MTNKVLGIVERAYFGMRNGDMGMILTVETYLHGKTSFFFPVDKVKPLLEKYRIPDIAMFYECPVIIDIGNDKSVKFVDFCQCRRLGYDTNCQTNVH